MGAPMSFDFTVNVGNLLTIAAVVVVALRWGLAFSSRFDRLETDMTQVKANFVAVQQEMRKITDILTVLARYEEKFLMIDHRLAHQRSDIDDLRRGRGLIRESKEDD